MKSETTFAYDKLLYPNYLHTQTHPDRLATMAKFYGMNPAPVENCRVLELGCGTGSGLMSFAYDLKNSQLIGVDLSEKQIAIGQETIEELGIENLKLMQGDIAKLSRETLGEFDYIIAHGVYSWVPDFVRDRMLALCRELLTENGVAYISYNALPGCHFRQIVREMMMFHCKDIESPVDKVNNGLGLLKFASESAPDELYRKILQDEFQSLSERDVGGIYHDDLADFNDPVYFHQFIEHIDRHDLQFLCEAEYPSKLAKRLRGGHVLDAISNNRLEMEQYLDFLNGRSFRQTLLCRKTVKLSQGYNKQSVRNLFVASSLMPESEKPDITTDSHEVFCGLKKEKVEIDHPLTKSLLAFLYEIRPESVPFEEAIEIAAARISAAGTEYQIAADDWEIATEIFYNLFCTGQIRLESHKVKFARNVSEKPLASRIARHNAARGEMIATLLCTNVAINDPVGRKVVELLDGTQDHNQLQVEIAEFIKSEDFDRPAEVKEKLLISLPAQFESNLKFLASIGILEA